MLTGSAQVSHQQLMLPPLLADWTSSTHHPVLLCTAADPLFCCDLKVTDLKVTNWTAQLDGKGKDCAAEAPVNTTATAAGGASPAPGTASPAPRNSAAAAGASVAALLGSLVLAALL